MPEAKDAISAITKCARKLIADSGLSEPPFSPSTYAPLRSVQRIVHREMTIDGRLVPIGDGFIIELRRDQSLGRTNFTCAHELAHTFFYELVPTLKSRSLARQELQYDAEEERLCDIAASELIMPARLFRKIAADFYPSPKSVCLLAKQFESSMTATAIRLLDLGIWDVSFILWEIKNDQPQAKWIAKRNGGLNRRPELKILNSRSSSIYQTFTTTEATSEWEYLITQNGTWPCRVESFRLSSGKVLSCVRRSTSSGLDHQRDVMERQRVLPGVYDCTCNGSGWRMTRMQGYVSASHCLAATHSNP